MEMAKVQIMAKSPWTLRSCPLVTQMDRSGTPEAGIPVGMLVGTPVDLVAGPTTGTPMIPMVGVPMVGAPLAGSPTGVDGTQVILVPTTRTKPSHQTMRRMA